LQKTGSILLHMSCTGMKRRPSLVLEIAPVWNHNSSVYQGREIMNTKDQHICIWWLNNYPTFGSYFTEILSAWITCNSIIVSASSCVQNSSGQCNSIDPFICKILPPVHAVTGCDTTSSMFGICKRTVFKVLKDRPRDFIDLSSLADCDIDQSVYVARKLVA
jgi:hypothetical protein